MHRVGLYTRLFLRDDCGKIQNYCPTLFGGLKISNKIERSSPKATADTDANGPLFLNAPSRSVREVAHEG